MHTGSVQIHRSTTQGVLESQTHPKDGGGEAVRSYPHLSGERDEAPATLYWGSLCLGSQQLLSSANSSQGPNSEAS